MNSSHKNKTFDVLQAILQVKKLNFRNLSDVAGSDISAAILATLAVIAEIPPSRLLSLRVS